MLRLCLLLIGALEIRVGFFVFGGLGGLCHKRQFINGENYTIKYQGKLVKFMKIYGWGFKSLFVRYPLKLMSSPPYCQSSSG